MQTIFNNRLLQGLPPRWWCIVGVLLFAIASTVAASPKTATEFHGPSKIGWHYDYDSRSRIKSITDPAGRKTKIRYTQDRTENIRTLTREHSDGSKVKYSFDKRGRRERMVDSTGTVQYDYDKFDRLTKVRRDEMPAISYRYDTLDRIESVDIGGQFSTGYEYDYLGRPEKISTPVGSVLFRYNSKTGSVVRKLPNGISTRWVYSPDGRLESITHSSRNNKTIAQYQYTYRLDGLVTSIRELTPGGVNVKKYKYDTTQRLVLATGAHRQGIEYSYDKLGNRIVLRKQGSKPAKSQYDWAGRLISRNDQNCYHDRVGNLTSCDGDPNTLSYHDTGLLKTVSANNVNVRYLYDGDGSLISRIKDSSRQTFLPNPLSDIWQPLLVTDPRGNQTFFVWDGKTPLIEITGKATRYFLHDHLGSVRLVADRRGSIIERRNYLPFGKSRGEFSSESLQPGFAGLFFDEGFSLYLTRARAYDPKLGRFLQPDPEHRVPIGSQKDMSLYVYCGGDPVNFVDLDGVAPGLAQNTINWWRTKDRESQLYSLPIIERHKTIMPSEINADLNSKRIYVLKEGLKQFDNPEISAALKGYSYYSSAKKFAKYLDYSSRHKGDLSALLKGASVVMNLAGYAIPHLKYAEKLLDTGIALGDSTRSQMIQLRTLGLVRLPLGEKMHVKLNQKLDTDWGKGSMRSSDGRLSGTFRWSLHHRNGVALSSASADYKLDNYRLYSGSRLSMRSNVKQHRIESPGSTKVTTRRRIVSQEIRNGHALHKAVEEQNRTGIYDPGKWERRLSDSSSVPPKPPSYSSPIGNTSYNRGATFFASSTPIKSSNFSPLTPTKVGGIRLAGAGNALSHLGTLEGIALDETNDRLILISKGKRPIDLPPLRLDDVVTIFRSVYQHGEAPSVSIDPISNRKNERFMTVRHGSATPDTYVGWVLYEADRIMKTYQLGKDNRTKKRIHSRVSGYRDFYKSSKASKKGDWERFWIVPASLDRRQSSNSELTLFDVPLKVETERMDWQGGKLVTARNPTPSKPAQAFQDWFTSRYDEIAKEVLLKPARQCGIKSTVAVFQELRRIALITAIAETLQDQDVPFPAWMEDYPVKSCPIDKTTPILKVSKRRITLTGGVRLAASDKDVHTYKNDAKANRLVKITKRKIAAKPLFSPVSFSEKGVSYGAVALPGADTLQVGANILQHTDLSIPVSKDNAFQLTRRFNSFHDPHGVFGRGWTLDLPRLESQKKPVSRKDNRVLTQTVYQLNSPLGSWSERFSKIQSVPEVNGKLMVPAKSGEMLGLADSHNRLIGQKTKELIFRDGRSWHFDKQGYLVARSESPLLVVYQRDKKHRISAIKSWHIGKKRSSGHTATSSNPDALLKFTYDGERVQTINGHSPVNGKSSSVKAHYFYNRLGQLILIIGSGGKTEYTYNKKNGMVTSVVFNGKNRLRYKYNAQGQLREETLADGRTITYKTVSTSYGTKVVAKEAGTNKILATAKYDANYRAISQTFDKGIAIAKNTKTKKVKEIAKSSADSLPPLQTFDDGSKIARNKKDQLLETVITQPNGDEYTITERNDGRHSTVKTPSGEIYKVDFDTEGRVTRAQLEDGPTIEQKWHSNGLLRSVISDTQAVLPKYTKDKKLSSVTITTPEQARSPNPNQYVEVNYDPDGRIKQIEDDSGSQVRVKYNKSGQPSVMRSQRGTVSVGYDNKERVTQIGTTWGYSQKNDYDKKSGDLSMIRLQQQYRDQPTESVLIELTENGISKVRNLDGGETQFSYFQKGSHKGLLKTIRTPGEMPLAYRYDDSDRLTRIDIGDRSTGAYRVNYDYDLKGRLTGLSYRPVFR